MGVAGTLQTAAVAALLVVTACSGGAHSGSPSQAGNGDECQGTTPKSQVVVYSTIGLEYWYADVLSAFETDCAVQIAYISAPPNQILERLRTEAAAPLADVVIDPAPQLADAAADGLLGTDRLPEAAAIPDDRCDPARSWCEVAETYTSWVAATSEPPTDFQGLLGHSYAGQILTVAPDSAVDGLALLLQLVQQMGEQPALAYLAALEHNIGAHFPNADAMSREVAANLALVSNGDLQEHLNDLTQFGGLSIFFPSATTLEIPFGAAIVRGGHNAANARALLAFLWSARGQRSTPSANVSPALPGLVLHDARSMAIQQHLKGIRILRVDWSAERGIEPRLIAAWAKSRSAPYIAGAPPPTAPPPLSH